MENSWINLTCYWNNRIKNSSGVFELVFFVCLNLYFFIKNLLERNLLKMNKKSLTVFKKKKNERRKIFFYKLKKLKAKKLFSWNLHQKGLLQNGLATKCTTPKRATTKRAAPKTRVLPSSILVTWSPWFGQIVVFEADYDEIKLQNIVMMSFQWCHHHYVTEKYY